MKTKTYDSARTAGLTSEAAVRALGNRYDLILVGARRMRELGRGDQPRVLSKHNHAITAMLEIEAGVVDKKYLLKELDPEPRRQRRQRNTF